MKLPWIDGSQVSQSSNTNHMIQSPLFMEIVFPNDFAGYSGNWNISQSSYVICYFNPHYIPLKIFITSHYIWHSMTSSWYPHSIQVYPIMYANMLMFKLSKHINMIKYTSLRSVKLYFNDFALLVLHCLTIIVVKIIQYNIYIQHIYSIHYPLVI